MTIKKPRLIRFVLFCLAWLLMAAVPFKRIIDFEWPASEPAVFLLRTSLYDPYDPFHGRYVQLSFDDLEHVALSAEPDINKNHSPCYASFETGADGFAAITGLYATRDKAPAGATLLKIQYLYRNYNPEQEGTFIYLIKLPCSRFYVNEKIAPEAERLVRENSSNGKVVLKLKIYANGAFAADDLLIDGKSIRELK